MILRLREKYPGASKLYEVVVTPGDIKKENATDINHAHCVKEMPLPRKIARKISRGIKN